MRKNRLSERDDTILREVVRRYIRTGRPVSSGSIARSGRVSLSSATVRNVLRSLEDRGLISQPHTSAGRVPTDRGYRYYVDHLMGPVGLPPAERTAIGARIAALGDSELGEIVAEISRLMSERARQLAVTLAPAPGGGVVDRVELVALAPDRILAVAATKGGLTRSVVLRLGIPVSAEDVRRAAQLVRRWLGGATMADAEEILSSRAREEKPPVQGIVEALRESAPRLFRAGSGERVHYEGARYIFCHPELASDASLLSRIFDSEESLAALLQEGEGRGPVSVRIGRENGSSLMGGLSMIVGSYRVGGSRGRLGVIGPTRMRYSRVIGLVDHFSRLLDELFAERTRSAKGAGENTEEDESVT